MVEVIVFFLAPLVSFGLLTLAFAYENAILGLLAGFGFLGLSVVTFINPLPDLSLLHNSVLGSIYFGVGAYVFVTGSFEEISKL